MSISKTSTTLYWIGFIMLCISATVAFHHAMAPHISLQMIRVLRVAVVVWLLTHNVPPVHQHALKHALHASHRHERHYHFLIAIGLLCASLLLTSGVGWLLARWLPHTNNSDTVLNGVYQSPFGSDARILLIVLTAMLGAVDEELLFRVLCYRMWLSTSDAVSGCRFPSDSATPHQHNPTSFIACSTALFSGAHIGLPLPTLLHSLGASIVLSAFYARYRSIPLTIALHAATNIIAIALYYF